MQRSALKMVFSVSSSMRGLFDLTGMSSRVRNNSHELFIIYVFQVQEEILKSDELLKVPDDS